ncbi:hypothetical protein [Polaribacter sp. Q13]|uniref:hypothetical protein n=1 Tax=Polaribacter sp. Q13 TaxID=2806551 RepID=UPI00193C76D4|nr:hypothetical protein [Polaribacter sp. Q13]QVY66100.1 hypothetical protein JOP69_02050 [Polaribacter sp. Q13]
MTNRHLKIILHFAILLITFITYSNQRLDNGFDEVKLLNSLSTFEEKKDTLQLIETRFKLIQFYSKKGNYSKSYDEIWKLFPLVESPKYLSQKIGTLSKLISLYMVFEQHKKAKESYLQAVEIIENKNVNEDDKELLLGRIYNLGAWIEIKATFDFEKAEQLALKSIENFKKSGINEAAFHYSEIQLAHIYIKKNEPKKAKNILFKLKNFYPLPLKKQHTLLFQRLGQYYELEKDKDSAIYFYNKSLSAIDKFENQPDKKLQILNRLSENYELIGNDKIAYKYLLQASKLNDQLFSSNKSQNKELFEIKNKYELQLTKNNELLKTQQIKLLQGEKEFWRLKLLSIIIVLSSLFGIGFFYFKRKNKLKLLNQRIVNEKQQLEIQKQEEILGLKNKELLSSAMQLLERDTLQEDIKKQLNRLNVKGDNIKIIKDVKNSLNISTKGKWKEFQSHFTKINDSFYSSLKANYPLLTPTDLKMCAFIKLGFSSKEMAQIMGISVEGINTSRSRLRKKMDLPRITVLSEFLQGYS